MQVDFLGLEAFVAIAEAGSFQQAAARLHLSQTAISHRMRKLEESLGVRLIARTTRDITLTDAGHALLPRARAAIRELAASCDMVRTHGQNANDWLSIACLPTVSASLIVPLLRACGQRLPDTPVRVFDNSIPEIAELVASRTVSFGISVLAGAHADLAAERIADEPFVLVCPQGHPLAGGQTVRWEQLASESLIRISLPSGNSMTIDDALGPLRDRLRWRYEAQHNALALDMVRGGLGLTVVPQLSVQPVQGLRVVRVEQPAIHRTLAVVTRRDAVPLADELWMREACVRLVREALAQPL
jgi:DNA-binding transcriptional LysR family regulator